MDKKKIPEGADFSSLASSHDKDAVREAEFIANGKDLARVEKIKTAINYVALCALAVLATGVILSLGVWFFHLLTPREWGFLEDENLRRIETVIFSGILVGIAQRFVTRHI